MSRLIFAPTLDEKDLYIGGLNRPSQPIVVVKGTFDLTHAGHVMLFAEAAVLGSLIVLVEEDSSVRNRKGQWRPILDYEDRSRIVASMRSVDFVSKFNYQNLFQSLVGIQPDYFCASHFSYLSSEEQSTLRSLGVEMRVLPKPSTLSTTEIVQRACNSARGVPW